MFRYLLAYLFSSLFNALLTHRLTGLLNSLVRGFKSCARFASASRSKQTGKTSTQAYQDLTQSNKGSAQAHKGLLMQFSRKPPLLALLSLALLSNLSVVSNLSVLSSRALLSIVLAMAPLSLISAPTEAENLTTNSATISSTKNIPQKTAANDTNAQNSDTTATKNKVLVSLKTDLGEIIVELWPQQAPKTVANFLNYVDKRFYDGTIFHRVIPNFMVQTGGMTFDFVKKQADDTVANESANGLLNTVGTLAMARLSDPDSARSQFFINLNNNTHLDPKADKPGFTVFGSVIKGLEIATQIAAEPRGLYRAFPHAPNVPVRILKASRVNAEQN